MTFRSSPFSTDDAVGSGAIEATSDLVVGVIGMGTGPALKEAFATRTLASGLSAGTLVLLGAGIDGGSEFNKAVIDGKTVRQGLVTAGTRAVLDVGVTGIGFGLDSAFAKGSLEKLSFPITVARAGNGTESLVKLGLENMTTYGAEKLVTAFGSDPGKSASSYQSLACTYLPQPDSDLVYVEQHAMKPA